MHSQTEATSTPDAVNAALRIVDDAWQEARRSPFVQQQLGVVPAQLPDMSFAEAQRKSEIGRDLLQRVAGVDQTSLPHDLALTLRLVCFRAQTWSREADWYWTAVDPLGIGVFGLFLPTAYCGGWILGPIHDQLSSFQFCTSDDAERYLARVLEYGRLIDQFTERTSGQARRGVRMPKVQVLQARVLLQRFKSGARAALSVSPERTAQLHSAAFDRELRHRVARSVEPAFDRALAGLSDNYFHGAPDTVGLSQYPGGAEMYAELVKLHTTLDLTPEQVHARGHERMAEIEAAMTAIRTEVGFKGDGAAFRSHLEQDPRWRADTIEGVQAVFQKYIDRVKPHLNEYFPPTPRATYCVTPLPQTLEASMTYGFYDPPRRDRPGGRYLFNAGNLVKQALFHIGSLTYHELVPGHHFHIATQQENESLHAFRKYSFVLAYNEGWAEYAATFAGEIGMYELPEERYGRLVFDAFLTSRLVVDTGMNALGWSLEDAREYMRKSGGMTEGEIRTESIRYSCDIPGQALAYKLGDTHILAMRERVREALGNRFRLKDFHRAVLAPGGLPLRELESHVQRELKCEL